MNPLLEQLHDIEGIDPINWWPLGIGWWAVLAAILFAAIALVWAAVKRRAFNRSWRRDTLDQLDALEKNLSEHSLIDTAITLSTYLRRIAVRRFSRKECAGLAGESWLEWLSARDPKGFDWKKQGKVLIDAPYAPSEEQLSKKQLHELIQAVKRWVR